ITAAAQAKIWEAVTKQGWDAAHKIAKDTGIKQKGAWEATTNERYGSRKSESWLPADWHEGLETSSIDNLESEVARAKADLEDKIAQQAVDRSGHEELKARADKSSDASAAVDAARQELESANAARRKLPDIPEQGPDFSHETECPLCGGTVHFTLEGDNISLHAEAPPSVAPAVVDARQADIKKADERMAEARNEVFTHERAYRDAQMAKDALAGADQGTGGTMTPEDINTAREDVRIAEQRLGAFKRKADAERYARAIAANQVIASVLAPDGLRKTILARAIDKFNDDYLARFCDIAKWPSIKLKSDLNFTVNGRIFGLCCESEQYCARRVMQLALAKIEKAPMVVIDRADVLDEIGRNSLFTLLHKLQIPALVAMTMNRIESVPDLQVIGVGRSYWLEDGQCTALVTDKAA
ncbi:hypothetical protein LCGC14_2427930, partial [marine sediment metagenome]